MITADFETLPHVHHLPVLLALAEMAIGMYDLPPLVSVKLVNLSENATYKVETENGRMWALRIHRYGYHTQTAIASELAWLIDLRLKAVALTPVPIQGRNGEFIQVCRHPRMASPRSVVLFKWEMGAEPGIGEDLAKPFEALGEVAARMHLHAKSWARPPCFQRLTWDFETSLGELKPHWGRWREGMAVDAATSKIFGRAVDVIGRRLAAYGKGADRFGLIHGDLRLANLLVEGDVVKVIDFDDCGFGWFMYDAATPVSFHEHEPQVPELIEHWKQGYRKVMPLSAEDEAEIPSFVMLRRILLVAWIGSHHETDLAQSMGVPYTEGSLALCEDYLRRFG